MLKRIAEELNLPAPPFWFIGGLLILLSLHLVPFALIARARVTKSDKPRLHLFLDMDNQAKLKAQAPSPVFADGRAMRDPVPGTVAWGTSPDAPDPDPLALDDHYYRGYQLVRNEQTGEDETVYFEGFPEGIVVSEELMLRGQARYNTFCYPCHGYGGLGNGPIHERAVKIKAIWVPPSNLTDGERTGRAEGHLYNSINNGIRNMAGYGRQISVEDRWAIVAYLRALQLRQNAAGTPVAQGDGTNDVTDVN